MPNPPPDAPPPSPDGTIFTVYAKISDTEPVQTLLKSLARLYERMAAGEVTIEQATDELERVLTTLMGETM